MKRAGPSPSIRSTWPRTSSASSRPRSTNRENLSDDEPALKTRILSAMPTPPVRILGPCGVERKARLAWRRTTAARAAAPSRGPLGDVPSSDRLASEISPGERGGKAPRGARGGRRTTLRFDRVQEDTMKIGIIGSGNIGGTAARLFAAAGHEVALSHKSGPEALREQAAQLGEKACAMTVDEAA